MIVEAYTAEDEIIEQLEEYGVPVLATKGADAADPIQNMMDTFTLIAQATGREERADGRGRRVRRRPGRRPRQASPTPTSATDDFVYFDGWIQGGNVAIRPFGQGSLMGELGEALGLTNAWTGEVDPAYGLGQTDIEGMTGRRRHLLLHRHRRPGRRRHRRAGEEPDLEGAARRSQEGRVARVPGRHLDLRRAAVGRAGRSTRTSTC